MKAAEKWGEAGRSSLPSRRAMIVMVATLAVPVLIGIRLAYDKLTIRNYSVVHFGGAMAQSTAEIQIQGVLNKLQRIEAKYGGLPYAARSDLSDDLEKIADEMNYRLREFENSSVPLVWGSVVDCEKDRIAAHRRYLAMFRAAVQTDKFSAKEDFRLANASFSTYLDSDANGTSLVCNDVIRTRDALLKKIGLSIYDF